MAWILCVCTAQGRVRVSRIALWCPVRTIINLMRKRWDVLEFGVCCYRLFR